MLRAVLDANVLVSATIIHGKQFEILKLAKLGKIKLITSPSIAEEFKEVISRDKFGFTESQVSAAVGQLLDIAEVVIPQQKLLVIEEDPDDNIVLECALESKADFIISGDTHLLALKSFKNSKIVNAAEFFEKFYVE